MSEASDLPDGSRLTAALAGLSAAVAELASVASQTCWQETDQALLAGLVELGRLTRAQDAALHRLVREVDRRGTATGTGAPSTAAWLRERLHLHPGAAKRLVTTARGLHDDPSGALVHHTGPDDGNDVGAVAGRPVLAAVFEAGTISGEHAAVAVRVLAELPAEVEPDVVAEAEQYLATEAARRDPAQLARLGRHLTHVLDPHAGDTLDDEPKPADRQHLGIRARRDGSADLRGRLSPETTAALLAQLQPLAGPRPTVDGNRDLRTPDQRTADALAELLRRHCRRRARRHQPRREGDHQRHDVPGDSAEMSRRPRRHPGLGRAGVRRDRPPAGLRRPDHPRPARQLGGTAGRRPRVVPGHPRHLAGPGRPGRRLRLRHLRTAR